MAVKVSKIYHKLKDNEQTFERLYLETVKEHYELMDRDEFTKTCRVIVVIDACEGNDDTYVVLTGKYDKEVDQFNYEGVYEGVEYYNYQYQGEETREDLYTNLIQQMYNEAVDGSGNKIESYYTDDAIDVLSIFNIYQDERYLYSVGLDMNLKLSEDGSTLHDDAGWRVLTEDNLFIINVSE